MKSKLLFIFLISSFLLTAQSKVVVDIASPKPSILIDGVNCTIGNTIYSCTPKTCNPLTITEGDSIQFCTNNQIFLNTDTAYWMQWNFTGSSNYSTAVTDSFPSTTPICYYPKWTTVGNYTVDIFYNGWLSAYPTSDCYSFGPSHWIINITVLSNLGISSINDNSQIRLFPNPSNGTFSLEGNFREFSQLHIYNLLGEEVMPSIVIPGGTQNIPMELNLADGIYIYRIVSENKILGEGKIAISKF